MSLFRRMLRLLSGALLPILIPSLFAGGASWITTGEIDEGLKGILFLLFGILYVGPYSLVAALLMEFVVNPRVERDWPVYLIGAGMGMVAGFLPFFGAGELPIGMALIVGLPMGLLTAWYMRRGYRLGLLKPRNA